MADESEAEAEEDPPPSSSSGRVSPSAAPQPCKKCTVKKSKAGCRTQTCIACCKDTNCAAHNEARSRQVNQAKLLSGDNVQARLAKYLREGKLARASQTGPYAGLGGDFFEQCFDYHGETVKVWDLRDFVKDPRCVTDLSRRFKGAGRRGDQQGGKGAAEVMVKGTKEREAWRARKANVYRAKMKEMFERMGGEGSS